MPHVILDDSLEPVECTVISETDYDYAMVIIDNDSAMITCTKIKPGLYIEVDYDKLDDVARDIDLLARKIAWDFYEYRFNWKDK